MHTNPPVVDWTPESGIDPFDVRWQGLVEVRSSDPIGPDGSILPPSPEDGVRHIVVLEQGTRTQSW